MTVSDNEYALLADAVYISTRGLINQIPYPEGWEPTSQYEHVTFGDGFEAAAYRKVVNGQVEIVISFAGTYPTSLLDWQNNALLASGQIGSSQLIDAAIYYQNIKNTNPGATISFTGHSLGGGLASLMAVFFNKRAVTFDQAPFVASATMENAALMAAFLLGNGYGDDLDLAAFYSNTVLGYPTSIRGEENISGYAVKGEFLTVLGNLLRIGNPTEIIDYGSTELDFIQLHSQDLLVALKTSENLLTSARSLSFLLNDLFDENLFAADVGVENTTRRDLLANLIRYEFGILGEENSDLDLLTKFGNDTAKLSSFASAGQVVTEPLLKILMNYYYEKMIASDVMPSEFLTKVAGGLQFDLTQPMGETALSAIEGYADLLAWITQQVPATLDFNIYDYLLDPHRLTLGLGNSVSAAAPNDSVNDFMLGGAQSSYLNGGAGDDVLVGMSGGDVLVGGADDDTLVGGTGNDRYEFKSGDGTDTIIDSDGKGSIYIDGQLIAYGFHQQGDDATVFHSQDGKYTFTQSGNDLVITPTAGGSDSITVRDYFADAGAGTGDPELEGSGVLGIELDAEQLAGYGGANIKDYFFEYVAKTQSSYQGGSTISAPDAIAGASLFDFTQPINTQYYGVLALTGDATRPHGYLGYMEPTYENEGDYRYVLDARERALEGAGETEVLYAGGAVSASVLINDNDNISSSNPRQLIGEFASGGRGDDYILGSGFINIMNGGSGRDVLIGGDGDDDLSGDFQGRVARFGEDAEPGHEYDLPDYYIAASGVDAQGRYEYQIGGSTHYITHDEDGVFHTTHAGANYSVSITDFDHEYDGNDLLYGGDGKDTLFGNGGSDALLGGTGDDVLQGFSGSDFLAGGEGQDKLYGDFGAQNYNYLLLNGIDYFYTPLAAPLPSRTYDDYLDGSDGADSLYGGYGADTIFGGEGNDFINGGYVPAGYESADGDDYLDGGPGNDTLIGASGGDRIYGGAGSDQLFGDTGSEPEAQQGDDYLYGGDGNDQLQGFGGDDALQGDAGSDSLFGGAGNDTLIGGKGVDVLRGEANDDTYVFNLGDSLIEGGIADSIHDGEGHNTIHFGAGVDPANFIIALGSSSSVSDIVLRYSDTDYLVLAQGVSRDFDLVFSNGSRWSIAQFLESGLSSPPTVAGTSGNDELSGDSRDDVIYGGAGDDVVEGSQGNDQLIGGAGSDTFLFGLGDGQDTITGRDTSAGKIDRLRFSADISTQDIAVVRDGLNLVLQVRNSEDRITVVNYFVDDGQDSTQQIQEIFFADNTVWDVAAVKALSLQGNDENQILIGFASDDAINALGGDDVVIGLAGDDVLDGGAGNDTLYGESGADSYLFGRGSGNDVIVNNDASESTLDVIRLGEGIAPADVTLSRVAGQGTVDLLLAINGTSDSILVQNYFESDVAAIDQIVFADGTVWDAEVIDARIFTGTEAGDVIYGTARGNRIRGAGGNDTLWGLGGNDVLDGGAGRDVLYGGIGDDVLSGGAGDRVGGSYADSSDVLDGGSGNDTYRFGRGSGRDEINSYDTASYKRDVIQFDADINPSDVLVKRYDLDLALILDDADDPSDNGDVLYVHNFFVNEGVNAYRVEEVHFANGSIWDVAEIKRRSLLGDDFSNTLTGFSSNDVVEGYAGDDVLRGAAGNDILSGGSGSDWLYGDSGNDTLNGGEGDDFLRDSGGNDTYIFTQGAGRDEIYDINGQDVVQFGQGIELPDLNFARIENDLVLLTGGSGHPVSVNYQAIAENALYNNFLPVVGYIEAGDSDYLYIHGLFSGEGASSLSTIERFEFSDGTILDSAAILGAVSQSEIWGGADANTLSGDGSNNAIYGFDGDDAISGLSGADTLYGGGGNDLLTGGDQNDVLFGGGGSDTLAGGRGNDWLWGGSAFGDEYQSFSDTYVFNLGDGQDVIVNAEPLEPESDNDVLQLNVLASDIHVARDPEVNDLLIGINGTNDTIRLMRFFEYGDEDVVSIHAIETVRFADGEEWNTQDLIDRLYEDSIRVGGEGADTIFGAFGDDVISGNAGDDRLFGDAGNDTLNGDDGDDILDGGEGDDYLSGGAGSDTYIFSAGSGHDTLLIADAQAGDIDVLRVDGVDPSDVELSRDSDDLILSIPFFDDVMRVQNYFIGDSVNELAISLIRFADATQWDAATILQFVNGAPGEVIYGTEQEDALSGTDDNDVVYGLGGADEIDGGQGRDTLIGGAGDDYYRVDNTGDVIVEELNEGHDSVESSVSYVLPENVESLYLSEVGITGIGNNLSNYIRGSDSNMLYGMGGDDVIEGDVGDNVINGGEGDDELAANVGSNTFVFDSGFGRDKVWIGRDGLADWIVFAAGITPDQVTVSHQNNQLVFTINGTTDRIGLAGYYTNNSAGDLGGVRFADGTEWSAAEVEAMAVATGSESLVVTGTAGDDVLVGLGADDTLVGLAGNDVLDGGYGADVLEGGGGDDVYYVDGEDDAVVEAADGGVDVVISAADYYELADNVEGLIVKGDEAVGFGNDLNNIITGDDNSNELVGGAGADTLIGLGGDDYYGVDDVNDVVIEEAGSGSDHVSTAVTYTLPDNVEDIEGIGSDSIDITGNALNNWLSGNAGDNTLDGGAGSDSYGFVTGFGHDTIIDSSGQDDLVYFSFAQPDDAVLTQNGDDLVIEFGADELVVVGYFAGDAPSSIERIVFWDGEWNRSDVMDRMSAFPGSGGVTRVSLDPAEPNDEFVFGTAGDDLLFGYEGNDLLYGGAGLDTLAGGSGDDIYILEDADVVVEAADEGFDTVLSIHSFTLSDNVEALALADDTSNWPGLSLDNLEINSSGTGNDLDNTIIGNRGDNLLDGGAGADRLEGGAGNDTYLMERGAGEDTIVDTDDTVGNTDVLSFLAGVATDQLWFRHVGNDLEVSIIGTSDSATIENWYSGSANHVEQFKTADGQTLLDSQVESLVSAMAAFSPPVAGQTTLPQNYQDQLGAVIAANWQ
jgi:Ca2+-binding RTX toxin-like protein